MRRLLVVNCVKESAIPFYRSDLPFVRMQEECLYLMVDIKHIEEINLDWRIVVRYDAVFLSNPSTDRHVDILKAFLQYNKGTWIDFDDDYLKLHLIKDSMPGKMAAITNSASHASACIKLAQEITVSVEYLKDVVSQVTDKKVTVVPNAFPIDYLNNIMLYKPQPGCHNYVTWRGKNHLHDKNLRRFKEPITNVGLKHKDVKFFFYGNQIDDEFFPEGFNYEHMDATKDIFPHILRMQELKAKIHIVPMEDIDFNHSKSMISWMEATLNGSAVLAPGWLEWRRPGIINYNNKEEFEILLNEMIEGKHNLQACYEKSLDYIENNLSLKIINKERVKILSRLLG